MAIDKANRMAVLIPWFVNILRLTVTHPLSISISIRLQVIALCEIICDQIIIIITYMVEHIAEIIWVVCQKVLLLLLEKRNDINYLS